MGLFTKKKKFTDNASSDFNNEQALARQDPRTRVHTRTAASVTTNTAVQNSTIIDSNAKTVTYQSTTQTVTHSQKACVTEMTTRRTPSQAELEDLLAQLRMNGGRAGSSSTTTTTNNNNSSKRAGPTSLYGVALRSTTSFKPNAEARRSSTLVKSEQTSVSQKQGRTVTQHVETQRVVLSPKTTANPTSATAGASSSSYRSNMSPLALKPIDSSYVSPYAKTTPGISSVFSKPSLITSSALPKAATSSYIPYKPTTPSFVLPKSTSANSVLSKPTSTSTALGTKPTPKTVVPKPFISLNQSKGAVPKTFPSSASSVDARAEVNPTKSGIGPIPKVKPAIKKKLKPAEVVILNNERFDNSNEYRSGSAKDVESLEKTFRTLLKCKVKTHTNPSVTDIRKIVAECEYRDIEGSLERARVETKRLTSLQFS